MTIYIDALCSFSKIKLYSLFTKQSVFYFIFWNQKLDTLNVKCKIMNDVSENICSIFENWQTHNKDIKTKIIVHKYININDT